MEEGSEIKAAEDGGTEPAQAGGELEELKDQLAKKEAEARENYDKYIRACADLDNFRKRAARDKEEYVKYSLEGMVRELLPVLDNLERAVDHSKASQDFKALSEGVDMTVRQFLQTLEKMGVKPVAAAGQRFDPALHDAITHVEEGEYQVDTVVTEHQKGYTLNDRLIRPSMVSVAKGKASA